MTPDWINTVAISLILGIGLQAAVTVAAVWLAITNYYRNPAFVTLAVACFLMLAHRVMAVALYAGPLAVAQPSPVVQSLRESNSLLIPIITSFALLAGITQLGLHARKESHHA